jgi:hypothetical protein
MSGNGPVLAEIRSNELSQAQINKCQCYGLKCVRARVCAQVKKVVLYIYF